MKMYGRVEMEVNGQFQALAALPRRIGLRYPSDRRMGGIESQSGRCGEKKNLILAGIGTPHSSRGTHCTISALPTTFKNHNFVTDSA
jgi:hypothetical protein